MKTDKKTKHPKSPHVTIDPSLDKYTDMNVFPEKLAKAKEMLKTTKLPDEIVSRNRTSI